ncbi:MAG: multidrug effflux MFS transporter [Lysobacteraceae bacterium]
MAPAPGRLRLALLLGALAMFGAFSIDTIFPAFPAIGNELGVGKVAMQQTISLYLVAYAVMSLFHGPVSDAVGRRRVILVGVAVFVLASVGCALAPSIEWLLAFRVLQGLSAGVGLIVGRAIVRDCLDGAEAQRLMAHIMMIFGIAPAVAPIIGGWILGFADWRAIFWFLAAFGVAIWVAVATGLPETHPAQRRTPVHPGRLVALNRAMLANPGFVLLCLVASFNFGALFLYIASAPAFVMDILGLGEQQFAWFFVPTIAGMVLGAFSSGRLAGRLGPAALARLGFSVCAAGMVLNLGYNLAVDVPAVPWAIAPMVLLAFGISIVFPVLTLAILDLYPGNRGTASSLQAFLSLSLNAALAGLLSPWISASPLGLAVASAAMSALAMLLWVGYGRSARAAVAELGP